MGSIDRYIFRTTFGAFLIVVVSLTAVIWVTQALRDIDLMTNQGQTILVFVGITGLIIPLLVLVIAPIALVIAVSYTLNKLNSDSEIVVMSAAGMAPWRLFRPFFQVSLLVAVLVLFISAYLAPEGLRQLHNWISKVRADLVANIVQPGRFTSIESGLTFHIRERRNNGQLLGIFIDDRRTENEHAAFLAEHGEILENERGTFLVLVNGSVQRHQAGQRDPTIVLFDRYAFDLSRFSNGVRITYGTRERYLWDLANPDTNDETFKAQPGQFRAEFHDRITAPLYPVAFTMIAYAALGAPRTTRQSRGFALGIAIAAVTVLRLIGFASAVFAVQSPLAFIPMYGAVIASMLLGFLAISRGSVLEPPALFAKLMEQLSRRLAPAGTTP